MTSAPWHTKSVFFSPFQFTSNHTYIRKKPTSTQNTQESNHLCTGSGWTGPWRRLQSESNGVRSSSGPTKPFWQRRWREQATSGFLPSHIGFSFKNPLSSLSKGYNDWRREGKTKDRQKELKESIPAVCPKSLIRQTTMDLWNIPTEGSPYWAVATPRPKVLITHLPPLCCHPFFSTSYFFCHYSQPQWPVSSGKRNQKLVIWHHPLKNKRKDLNYQPIELLEYK